MKRRILLVDDEVAVLLTLKAVLEISGFDVDTAASAREGISKLHTREYQMLITDMRMESDASGVEVIKAARAAAYHPAIALLTAFPVSEEDWLEMGAHKLLVKPMHTRILLKQIETLLASHEAKLKTDAKSAPQTIAKKSPAKKIPAKKATLKKSASPKVSLSKPAPKKTASRRSSPVSATAKKPRVAIQKSVRKIVRKPGTKP